MNDTFQVYTINPVIERLLRSKKEYQKNIMIPLLGIFIIFLIIILIQLLYTGNAMKIESFARTSDNHGTVIPNRTVSKSLPYSSSKDRSSTFVLEGGKVLFKKYKVVKEIPQITLSSGIDVFNKFNLIDMNDVNTAWDSISFIDSEDVLSKEFSGYDYDVFDDGKNLIEIAWGIFPKGISKDTILIEEYPDVPAVIESTEELQYPKGLYYGTVVLEFIIDYEGEIESLKVLNEEPGGKGLMECAKKYIENCLIKPAEKKGQKVNTKVTVNFEFCKDCPFRTRGTGNVVFKQKGEM
ncbi:MAG: energy transducer TonB [candidate division Zixibacteria bacterium]|nr:energy transducer TonB [candidate division Zixibacteria bacterium]MDD5426744.1 energy transducer TonB [candidate division Zixibacteria bacterium]